MTCVTLLNIIYENCRLGIVTVPVLRLVLVIYSSSSSKVVSVITSLAYSCCTVDPYVVCMEIANKVFNIC